jgi:glycosyltransferase involved in cell wall biosynthesis
VKRSKFRKEKPLFIVWKGYQRRVEVLAPLFDADVRWVPHLFRNRRLRPLDYIYKLVATVFHILRARPSYAIVQTPPHYAALPAIVCRLPYILDAHNALFQSYWSKLPLFTFVMRRARAVLVHNPEVLELFGSTYPGKSFFVVADPIERIEVSDVIREEHKILFICSFDLDEPIELIADVVEAVPECTFVITADTTRLPTALRQRIEACPNVRLTGFLTTDDYHRTLCTSSAAIALTNMVATQQSGACEALSSNTPLIASRSTLSEELFGEWATLVENTPDAIVAAIHGLSSAPLDLEAHRAAWNQQVHAGVTSVRADVLHVPADIAEPDRV